MYFIDWLLADEYDKLTVKAILVHCLCHNSKTSDRASCCGVYGFVEDQKLLKDQKHHTRYYKLHD